MARTANQVSHDLRPMIKTIQDLGENMSVLLPKLYAELISEDSKLKTHFETCFSAMETLNKCAGFAMSYIEEVNVEAEQEGIERHY